MKIKSTNPEVKSILGPNDKPGVAESEKPNKNVGSSSHTTAGVASVKSKFEMTQSPTTIDKMIEGKNLRPDDRDIRMNGSPEKGKVRENTGEVRNVLIGLKPQDLRQKVGPDISQNSKLRPDQFSINEKGQVVVQQNQAETLKAQTEKSGKSPEAEAYGGLGRPVADKTQSESHIWMNASTKRVSGRPPEVEAFARDNRERFATNNPESRAVVEPEDTPELKPTNSTAGVDECVIPHSGVDEALEPSELSKQVESQLKIKNPEKV